MQSYESFGGYPTADLDRRNLEDKVQELIRNDQPIPSEIFTEYMTMVEEESSAAVEAMKNELLTKTEAFHEEIEKQDEVLESMQTLAKEIVDIYAAHNEKARSEKTIVSSLFQPPRDNS